jgi:hypothetical protein
MLATLDASQHALNGVRAGHPLEDTVKPGYSRAALATLVTLAMAAAPAYAAKSPPVISNAPLTDLTSPGSVVAATLLSTSWEAGQGFVPGPLEPQNGYTASGTNLPWASISIANPAVGTQHLSLMNDVTAAAGAQRVALSPTVVVPANSPSTTTQLIYISNSDGADYDFVGQAPSQAFLSWRVKFFYLGNIYVLDDIGAGLEFVDTGVAWDQGVYRELKVQFDPAASEIRYYYDGNLIYTGTNIFAGSSVEQLVWVHDNYQLTGESGDIDAVTLTDTATDPVPVQASTWGQVKARYR